ncbi:F-box only protein 30 [Larimichthys crocea]|uniref:F-box only protein 30 n=1 Tax=Larimichthys crocea TaxID=215358 RepID=A0A6G0IFI6_LARCR|nr:F-box only protein 30 [Larimichthys crocea]
MESLHSHCLKCINRRCMIRPEAGVCCDLIGCPLVCGAVFHSCKLEEHRLLCPYERLPCLNSGFGCPFTIARIKMAKHLETCPASIVCCTMEWNRWPVSYSDRKSYENLSKDFDEVEQLDMALALQDQRMLLESLKVTTMVSKNGDKEADEGDKMATASGLPEAVFGNGSMEMEDEPYNELYRASETSRSLAVALDILSNSKDMGAIVGNLNGEKTDKNGALRNGDNHNVYVADGGKNVDMQESDSDSECELGAVGGADCAVGTDGEDGIGWADESDFVELFFEEKEDSIEEPINDSDLVWPEMPQDYMPVIALERPMPQQAPPMPFLLSDHVRNNFLHHLPTELRYRCLERKLQNVEVLRGISMFTFNGRRALLSDPYLFRAKMEDKAVDTSDLEVVDDPMGLHGIDLITAALLFCLGDSPEAEESQTAGLSTATTLTLVLRHSPSLQPFSQPTPWWETSPPPQPAITPAHSFPTRAPSTLSDWTWCSNAWPDTKQSSAPCSRSCAGSCSGGTSSPLISKTFTATFTPGSTAGWSNAAPWPTTAAPTPKDDSARLYRASESSTTGTWARLGFSPVCP